MEVFVTTSLKTRLLVLQDPSLPVSALEGAAQSEAEALAVSVLLFVKLA